MSQSNNQEALKFQIAQKISNLYNSSGYNEYKALLIEEIYDDINYNNIETPLKAYQTLSIMLGRKRQFEIIKEQKELADRLKKDDEDE